MQQIFCSSIVHRISGLKVGGYLLPNKARIGLEYSGILERRNEVDIIADILTEARKSEKKTHIMYNCNLNHKQCKTYIGYLLEVGLLESHFEDRKKITFRATSKGSKFLSSYSKLKALMT